MTNPFKGFTTASDHGAAMLMLGQNAAVPPRVLGYLQLGTVAAGDYVTIGDETYEFRNDTEIATPVGLNNTTDPLTINVLAHGRSVGDVLLIIDEDNDEFVRVREVVTENQIIVDRNWYGPAAGAHAGPTNSLQAMTAVTISGAIPVFTTANNPYSNGRLLSFAVAKYSKYPVQFLDPWVGGNTIVYAMKELPGTIELGGNIAAVGDVNPFLGLRDFSSAPMNIQSRTPTEEEVTIGGMAFVLPFRPRWVDVQVKSAADQSAVAWDGTTVVDASQPVITVTNSGVTDWATTHTVTVVAIGEPSIVSEAAVTG